MCGIAGFKVLGNQEDINNFWSPINKEIFEIYWRDVLDRTSVRGRHAYGISYVSTEVTKTIDSYRSPPEHCKLGMACFRGQPTTEVVSANNEFSVQPFHNDLGICVHNGIIANDKDLISVETVKLVVGNTNEKPIDSWCILDALSQDSVEGLNKLQGGFSIAHYDFLQDTLTLARNFKDLWISLFSVNGNAILFFASKAEFLPGNPEQIKPYTWMKIRGGQVTTGVIGEPKKNETALVVLSGGLDSTTVATIACRDYKEVHLLHFHYNCKAQTYEDKAVDEIYEYLISTNDIQICLHKVNLDFLRTIGGSRLTDLSLDITSGDTSAELDSEWVPARNLVMSSIAAAYCDRYNLDVILLGNNLEESAVYADNSLDFFSKLESALDVGTKSRAHFVSPLGNLMKTEIVKLAYDVGAPIHLSRSCYHDKPVECCSDPKLTNASGCGPCLYKKTALALNGLTLEDFKIKCQEILECSL